MLALSQEEEVNELLARPGLKIEPIVSAIVKLGLQKGDTIYFTEAPDGMSPFDSEFEEWMETAERIMHRDADALKALAELCASTETAVLTAAPCAPSRTKARKCLGCKCR